jgi:cell division protein FtsZ
MTINLTVPKEDNELSPRITVIGVGGAGCNAVNNMIRSDLGGVEFISTNTDSQALNQSLADVRIQLGAEVTQGLGAGSRPEVGRAAAEETIEEILGAITDSNMVFITAGMGGGTGTGAAPVIARAARERGLLTVGVVTKPFHFEGQHRMRLAESGIEELTDYVDTLIIIPNQNLFRIANEKTTFADAFNLADDVLHSGVRGVTDLMVMPGLINLDFADIRTVMSEMGKAMMGTGEATGEKRAVDAAEAAINNPLLEDTTMKGARGVLINITGGLDMTLFEVDEAANRIREEVDGDANIIFGSTFDEKMDGTMRVSVVATGIAAEGQAAKPRNNTLSLVRPASRTLEAPKTEIRPTAASATATAAVTADVFSDASGMSNLDITREASNGFGELSMPDLPADQANDRDDDQDESASAEEDREVAATAVGESAPLSFEVEDDDRIAEAKLDDKPFIAPAPTMPERRPATATPAVPANPMQAADMVNATGPSSSAPRPAAKSGTGLFRAITGLGLSGKRGQEEADEDTAPATGTPSQVIGKSPAKKAEPTAKPIQPRLGALNPGDRVRASQQEEDLLDIPAFLRRQAN